MRQIKIAPSILAADFAHLADDIARVENHVDMLHVDVMDGHFVPNLSLGFPVIAALRKATDLPFDCHFMTTNAGDYVGPLAEAGGDLMTIHIEAYPDPRAVAAEAAAAGLRFGLVVSPDTPVTMVEPFVELCDMVLVMSVYPGFGGQAFIAEVLPKIEALAKQVDSQGLRADIEVDGGIDAKTAARARSAGANVFVAGTAIFRAADPVAAIREIRNATE